MLTRPALHSIVVLANLMLVNCSTTREGPAAASRSGPSQAEDYIRLGSSAVVPATLTSNISATTFTISGVGTSDMVLPKTNIAKVVFPVKEVTISAKVKCFPDIVNHAQINDHDGDIEFNFNFTNANRRAGCEDDEAAPQVVPQANAAVPTRQTKLAWVIASSNYSNDWPPLTFVENDERNMVNLLRNAGFQLVTSYNKPTQELLADELIFRQRVNSQNWTSVIVYISGHGVGLQGQNYFVPSDAAASTTVGAADLFPIVRVQQTLRPISNTGSFAMVLVDACRSSTGTATQTMVANDNSDVPVNYSTSPGHASYDDGGSMSAWTGRFVSLANTYPWLSTDQLVMFADRYTKWQSTASLTVQVPVLYGRLPAHIAPFGQQIPAREESEVPLLAQVVQ